MLASEPAADNKLETRRAHVRVIIRAAADWPMIFALKLPNRKVIDRGISDAHQTGFAELPVFITVRMKPVSGIVVRFKGEPDCNAVIPVGPEFLD